MLWTKKEIKESKIFQILHTEKMRITIWIMTVIEDVIIKATNFTLSIHEKIQRELQLSNENES